MTIVADRVPRENERAALLFRSLARSLVAERSRLRADIGRLIRNARRAICECCASRKLWDDEARLLRLYELQVQPAGQLHLLRLGGSPS